jgi:hypothetical protein
VNFYDVRGVLVRRWEPVRHGICLERWDGKSWLPYPDLNEVLRHGYRLTDARALALLHETRNRIETLMGLSDKEARIALQAPGKRA